MMGQDSVVVRSNLWVLGSDTTDAFTNRLGSCNGATLKGPSTNSTEFQSGYM
jgi:hypothetical protein